MDRLGLQILISAVDRFSGPLKRIGKQVSNTTQSWNKMTGEATKFGLKMAAIGGGAAWLFKDQFIDTAAEFERYQTILETVMGSQDKAQKAMSWVSDFAAKTPYEMGQVTDAFVKLKAYGLDPIQGGLLTTLGDTAAAMGKPVDQAVEAMADAVTGEFERLKEFGVKASTKGGNTSFSFTDRDGKQQLLTVSKDNRKAIEETLKTIWNAKYAGAMDKMSQTWAGKVSNLADQWSRFKLMVMNSGVFDWLKDKLGGVLDQLDKMAANGELKKLAEVVGGKLKQGLIEAWAAGVEVLKFLKALGSVLKWTADLLGGWGNLIKTVAFLMAIPTISAVIGFVVSLVQLGIALWGVMPAISAFGAALMATPIGWIIGLVALLAGAAYLVYRNWAPISAFFKRVWEGVKQAFRAHPILLAALMPFISIPMQIILHWSSIAAFFKGLWASITSAFDQAISWITDKLNVLERAVDRMKDRLLGVVEAINAPINALASKVSGGSSNSMGELLYSVTHRNEQLPSVGGGRGSRVDLTGALQIGLDVKNGTAEVRPVMRDKQVQAVMGSGRMMVGAGGNW